MNIVQLGVCQSNDDVYKYILENKINFDLLILVEPMSIHNEKIWECYNKLDFINLDNIHLENVAITENITNELNFYYHPNDGPLFEVASTDPYHLIKHGYNPNELIQLKVPTLTMEKLFQTYNVTDIDLLAIDTEGLDDIILKSINYEKFNIKKIIFENLHIKDPKIYSFLESCGYKILNRNYGYMGWSVLAEKTNLRYDF